MSVVYDEELTWERDGEDAVVVQLPETESSEAWRISLGYVHPVTEKPDCNVLRIVDIVAGVAQENNPDLSYGRGAICTKEVSCPEGVGECESYQVIWCDEPPTKCEDTFPCNCP